MMSYNNKNNPHFKYNTPDVVEIAEIDKRMQMVVDSGIPVTRTTVSSSQLLAMDDVQLLPGETYPSQSIHLIQIQGKDFVSKYVFSFLLFNSYV